MSVVKLYKVRNNKKPHLCLHHKKHTNTLVLYNKVLVKCVKVVLATFVLKLLSFVNLTIQLKLEPRGSLGGCRGLILSALWTLLPQVHAVR